MTIRRLMSATDDETADDRIPRLVGIQRTRVISRNNSRLLRDPPDRLVLTAKDILEPVTDGKLKGLCADST